MAGPGDPLTVDVNLAGVRRLEPRHDAERRGLSAATGAEEREQLTSFHAEIEPPEDRAPPRLAHGLQLDAHFDLLVITGPPTSTARTTTIASTAACCGEP